MKKNNFTILLSIVFCIISFPKTRAQSATSNITENKLGSDSLLHLYISRHISEVTFTERERTKRMSLLFLHLHITSKGVMDTIDVINESEKDFANALLLNMHRARIDTLWQSGKERSIIIPFLIVPIFVVNPSGQKESIVAITDTTILPIRFQNFSTLGHYLPRESILLPPVSFITASYQDFPHPKHGDINNQ